MKKKFNKERLIKYWRRGIYSTKDVQSYLLTAISTGDATTDDALDVMTQIISILKERLEEILL